MPIEDDILDGGVLNALFESSTHELIKTENSVDNNIPSEYKCPITLELMNDPVVADDGFSYERDKILLWFGTKTFIRSPATGYQLRSRKLTPNYNLRALIDRYRHENGLKPRDILASTIETLTDVVDDMHDLPRWKSILIHSEQANGISCNFNDLADFINALRLKSTKFSRLDIYHCTHSEIQMLLRLIAESGSSVTLTSLSIGSSQCLRSVSISNLSRLECFRVDDNPRLSKLNIESDLPSLNYIYSTKITEAVFSFDVEQLKVRCPKLGYIDVVESFVDGASLLAAKKARIMVRTVEDPKPYTLQRYHNQNL